MSQTLRFPPAPRSELNPAQQKAYDEISGSAERAFGDTFTYKRADGAFEGPFTPLLETPGIVGPFFEVVMGVGGIGGLSDECREVVILATGSHFQAAYEIYAHERVAVKKTGLTREQVDLIKVGKKPTDLGSAESAAFDAAIFLVKKPGPLPRELWHACVNEMGRTGALALLHYVGLYAYTCVLLNGCDVKLPEGEEIM